MFGYLVAFVRIVLALLVSWGLVVVIVFGLLVLVGVIS